MERQKVIESKIIYKYFDITDSEIQETGKSSLEYINTVASNITEEYKDLDIFNITFESIYDKGTKSWNIKYAISYNPKVSYSLKV